MIVCGKALLAVGEQMGVGFGLGIDVGAVEQIAGRVEPRIALLPLLEVIIEVAVALTVVSHVFEGSMIRQQRGHRVYLLTAWRLLLTAHNLQAGEGKRRKQTVELAALSLVGLLGSPVHRGEELAKLLGVEPSAERLVDAAVEGQRGALSLLFYLAIVVAEQLTRLGISRGEVAAGATSGLISSCAST